MRTIDAIATVILLGLFGLSLWMTWAWWTFRITARESNWILPAIALTYIGLMIVWKKLRGDE